VRAIGDVLGRGVVEAVAVTVGDDCVAAVLAEGVGRTPREPHAAVDRTSNARAQWARRVATCAIDDSDIVLLSLASECLR
jgi:hypothetical protein